MPRKKSKSERLKRHVKAASVGLLTGALSFSLAWTLSLVYLQHWMKKNTQLASTMDQGAINAEQIWAVYVPDIGKKFSPLWHTMVYVSNHEDNKNKKSCLLKPGYMYDIMTEATGELCFQIEYLPNDTLRDAKRIYRLKKVKNPQKALSQLSTTVQELHAIRQHSRWKVDYSLCSNELDDANQARFFKIVGLSKKIFGQFKNSTVSALKIYLRLVVSALTWKAICEQVLPADTVLYRRIAQFATLAGASGTVLGTLGYYKASRKARDQRGGKFSMSG